MSTIKAKNIKQTVIGGTTQPLKLGGILDDGSDAKITIGTDGIPTVPTAAVDTNTTQIASTAFVKSQIADDAPLKSAVAGTLVNYIWSGTQVQYDAIGTKDANTLYFIVG